MTNENEQDVHAESIQAGSIHEQLCAYVLGELSGAERMEIERELLRSPDLRQQRDTIERTIGLVKVTMGKVETLSPEATESVFSAAKPSKPARWKSSGFLRLAAGLGAVALGFAIVRESNAVSETDVAKLETDAQKRFGGRLPTSPPVTDQLAQAELDKDAAQFSTKRERTTGLGYSGKSPAPAPLPVAGLTERPTPIDGGFVGTDAESAELKKIAYAEELVRRQRDLDASLKSGTPVAGVSTQKNRDLGAFYDRDGKEELRKRTEGLYAVQPAPEVNVVQPNDFKMTLSYPATPGPSAPSTSGRSGPGLSATAGSAGSVSQPATNSKSAHGTDHLVSGDMPGEADPGAGITSRGLGESVSPAGGGGARDSGSEKKRESDSEAFWVGEPEQNESPKRDASTALARMRLQDLGYVSGDGRSRDDESQAVPYYKLSPVDQTIYLERECQRILDDCRPRPNERPRDMYFRFWGDNPFEVTALDAQSTFAADVDTASYTLARRYINEGNLPTKAQIRTEEFVNYFKSDVAAPTSGVFAIHTDLAASRYSTDTTRQMLRVVVRGKDMSKVERPRMNLTFVVDVSGSMREQMRLEMVKTAIRLLVTQLTPYDRIGIVKFSTDASVVLPLTNVSEREKIELAIAPLQPEGSTNSNAGLELGYGMALGGIDSEATNRVVFLSDGVANVGETDPAKIAERVKPMREKGIYLNTIGVGMNNHNDVLLEQLADKADGMCTYIDTADEAKKQLVDNFSGAFQPIARDVKIQVEFDASQVLRYRLLGYENRAIADADFRNDKVDAGELGAGHQVTGLYEIERQGIAGDDKPLATVHVRWKEPRNFGLNPESDKASEITQVVAGSTVSTFEGAGQSYRKAVMAAQFAEILRRSVHARGDSLDFLLNDAVKLSQEIPADAEFMEFVTLVSKSKDLILRAMPACDELCQAIDEVRESQFRRAQIESMQRELDQKTLSDLKLQNDVLEAKLRDLVKRRLENQAR